MTRTQIDNTVFVLGGVLVIAFFWMGGLSHSSDSEHVHPASSPKTLTKVTKNMVGAEVAPTDCTEVAGQDVRLELSDTSYNPSPIAAHRCDSLVIKNAGTLQHQPWSDSYTDLRAPTALDPGSEFRVKLTSAGSYVLSDQLYPDLRATITIAD